MNNKSKDLVIILFLTFLAVIVWIGMGVYHNLNSSTIDEQLSIQVQPISPTFDNSTIAQVKQRQAVDPLYDIESATSSSSSRAPVPTITTSPESGITPSP